MRTNLKLFRVAHKMTQQQIADAIGYQRATYAAIESGKRTGRQTFWLDFQKAFNISDSEMWELMKLDA